MNLYFIHRNNLKLNGYLVFVTKTGWRSRFIKNKINPIFNQLKTKSILYSEVFDFKNNPFNANVLTNFFVIKNQIKTTNKKIFFKIGNENLYNALPDDMNIYFLPQNYLFTLKKLRDKYGDLSYITRKIPKTQNFILISHRTGEVLNKLPKIYKNDEFYCIENPNKYMKIFFNNYFKDMRHIGRFTDLLHLNHFFMIFLILIKLRMTLKLIGKNLLTKMKPLKNVHPPKTAKVTSKVPSKPLILRLLEVTSKVPSKFYPPKTAKSNFKSSF